MKRAFIIAFFVLIMLVCSGCQNINEVKKEVSFPKNYSGALEADYEGTKYKFAVNNNDSGSYIEVLEPEELAGLSYEIPYTGEIVINYNGLTYKSGINMLNSSCTVMRLHSVLQYPDKLEAAENNSFTDGSMIIKIVDNVS